MEGWAMRNVAGSVGGLRRAGRWPVAIVVAAVVVALLVPAAQGAGAVRPRTVTETFHYTGAPETTVVPAGVDLATVRVLGGHGGRDLYAGGTVGGDGADVRGRFGVSPGETLTVKVGGYGGDNSDNTNPGGGGWGATGSGGRGGGGSSFVAGAGGGGASGIEAGGQFLVVAGGGGGAGGWGFSGTGGPGGSSGLTVDDGHSGSGAGAGRGGGGGGHNQSSGGPGSDGSWAGGGGGGGGAGWVGGSGGVGGALGGGGGGGGGAGSSHISSQVERAEIKRGPLDGRDGEITITWQSTSDIRCADQAMTVDYDSAGTPYQLRCAGPVTPAGFRLLEGPAHGQLQDLDLVHGTFSYRPDDGFAGTDRIRFAPVGGGRELTPFTVTIVVTRQCFDETVYVPPASPGKPVTLRCAPFDGTGHFELSQLPSHGRVTDLDLSAGTFNYVPAADFDGTDTIRFVWVTIDGHRSKPATVTLIVAPRIPSTKIFHYTGAPQVLEVPDSADLAVVKLIGGHGGRVHFAPDGGTGGEVSGQFAVTPRELLTLKIGGYGGDGNGDTHPGYGGWGATGSGGRGGSSSVQDGAGGGGATGLELDGQFVAVAGGGGGAGGKGGNGQGGGGGNSAASAGNGQPGEGFDAGGGGTGAGNDHGGGGVGGNGITALGGAGGGGGAGWRGGGGGGGGNLGIAGAGGGGGGAGSSYTSERLERPRVQAGPSEDAAGLISITWEHTSRLSCPDQQVTVAFQSAGTPYQLQCGTTPEPSRFRLIDGPTYGRLEAVDLAHGTFTYVPAIAFSGTDQARFVAIAGDNESAPFTVRFRVDRGCLDQAVHVAPDGPGAAVTLGCTRWDGVGHYEVSQPPHGRFQNLNVSAGTFTYVPDPGFQGTDTITFRWVSMNGQFRTNTALLTLHVVPGAPPACPAQHLDNVPSGGIHIKLSCPAVGEHPTYRIVSVPKHGYLKSIDLAAGTAIYLPDPGYLGPDAMIFQAVDGSSISAQAEVTFAVTGSAR
jgi:hypothetical protein